MLQRFQTQEEQIDMHVHRAGDGLHVLSGGQAVAQLAFVQQQRRGEGVRLILALIGDVQQLEFQQRPAGERNFAVQQRVT